MPRQGMRQQVLCRDGWKRNFFQQFSEIALMDFVRQPFLAAAARIFLQAKAR
jgi:hypothetical protein